MVAASLLPATSVLTGPEWFTVGLSVVTPYVLTYTQWLIADLLVQTKPEVKEARDGAFKAAVDFLKKYY